MDECKPLFPGGQPNAFQQAQWDRQLAGLHKELVECRESHACLEAGLQDPRAMTEAFQFYRLVSTWLIWVATGRVLHSSTFQLNLSRFCHISPRAPV